MDKNEFSEDKIVDLHKTMSISYKNALEEKYPDQYFFMYTVISDKEKLKDHKTEVVKSLGDDDIGLELSITGEKDKSMDCMCILAGFKARTEQLSDKVKDDLGDLKDKCKEISVEEMKDAASDINGKESLGKKIASRIKEEITQRNYECHYNIGVIVMEPECTYKDGIATSKKHTMTYFNAAYKNSNFDVRLTVVLSPMK